MITISFILIFIGFILISLSMKRHYLQTLRLHTILSIKQNRILRFIGYLCLVIAGGICIDSLGVGLGLVYWTGLLTVAALLQSLLLTYRSRWILPSGFIAILAGVVIGAIA